MKITGEDLFNMTKNTILEDENLRADYEPTQDSFDKLSEPEQVTLNKIAEKINRAFTYGLTK